jgi:phage terminase large subunit-like protein|tara:strand:- start:4259 stop:5530 length:1272 start_codon:yes stop_codon:yes gene_type:complete
MFSNKEIELQERIRWTPHNPQKEILTGIKRFTVICAGTRFGKSQLCAYLALKKLFNPGTHIWIVSPTYDLSKKVFEHLNTFLGNGFPEDLKRGRIKIQRAAGKLSVRHVRFQSWVECKSAEFPTGLLGEELDLVIMDECSRMKGEVYNSYISQRLTSRKGSALFISTPFGQNWFYQQHIQNKDAEDGVSFHFTSKNNPYFPIDEWEREKKRLPMDVFNQEYEAAFLRDAAAVFRGVKEIVSGEVKNPEKSNFYVMGVDLGKYQDFTVLSVINRRNHQLVHFDRFKDIDWNLQKARIYETAKKYNGARITIDSTGVGDPITDDLRRMGLAVDDFKYTNKSKTQLIEKLSIFIEQKRFNIPPIEVLIDELEAFGYKRTDSGNIRYSAPEGLHDDCVNSLALAVWQLSENPNKKNEEAMIFKHPKY